MNFIAEHYDADLEISADDTKRHLESIERIRLSHAIAVISSAHEIPRRLGVDATPEELAADKKRCRRVSFALEQSRKAWGGNAKVQAGKEEIHRQAAHLVWDKWWADVEVYLSSRARYIATWQIKAEGDEAWTKKAITRLINERRWLQHAMRP